MNDKIQNLFIDVTHTAMGDTNHGIQRVVRNIALEAVAYSQTNSLSCIPVILQDGQFVVADDACVARGFRRTPPDQVSWVRALGRRLFPQGNVRMEQMLQRLGKIFYPRTLDRNYRKLVARFQPPPVAANMGRGDVLLLPDSWWCVPAMFDAIAQSRRAGVLVGTMIQDLIPIRHPELCDDRFTPKFRAWAQKAVQSVDFILGNSQTTRDDLWSFVQEERSPLQAWQVRHVRLGCNIETKAEIDPAKLSRTLRDRYANRNAAPYLMVSTIEIRKNHALLLDAFDQLWNQGVDVSLALIGRVGWKCDELLTRISKHREFGRRLFLCTDINDVELTHIYQNSKAFLFPSHAEGFGLPIAEALHHGLNVFASNLAIHHEVGGAHCRYFSPHDASELADLISQFEADQGWRSSPQAPTFNHPWATTFSNIVEQCRSIAAATNEETAVIQHRAA